MRKIIISAVLCLGMFIPTIAQEATQNNAVVNKRGVAILPQAGDFALGIDATPFLEYFGNAFNQSGGFNPAPYFSGVNNTIYGKYFLEDNRAIRAKLHLNFTQDKYKQTIKDDYAVLVDPTNSLATAIDTRKQSTNWADLTVGYEFRRGKGRLQAFYGGEVMLGFGKQNNSFEYGNPLTESNQNPTTHSFAGYGNTAPAKGYRVTDIKGGATFGVGLGGFVGIEYFFAPQISIGGEFSLGFDYYTRGQNETISEGYLGNGIKEYEYRSRAEGNTAFSTGVSTRTQGAIFLMFHF